MSNLSQNSENESVRGTKMKSKKQIIEWYNEAKQEAFIHKSHCCQNTNPQCYLRTMYEERVRLLEWVLE